MFPLPSVAARTSILGIHTAKWREPPSKELRQDLANLCVGYCGADLKARRGHCTGRSAGHCGQGAGTCTFCTPPGEPRSLGRSQQADFRSLLKSAQESCIRQWAQHLVPMCLHPPVLSSNASTICSTTFWSNCRLTSQVARERQRRYQAHDVQDAILRFGPGNVYRPCARRHRCMPCGASIPRSMRPASAW